MLGRAFVVLQWLLVLAETHPEYKWVCDIEDLKEKIEETLTEAKKRLQKNAVISSDPNDLMHEGNMGDDVASIRKKKACDQVHIETQSDIQNEKIFRNNVTTTYSIVVDRDESEGVSSVDVAKACFKRIGEHLSTSTSSREENPINEYENSQQDLICAFPHIFLLGNAYGPQKGGLTTKQTYHLLLQHTQYAAKDPSLLAYLFDQRRRHGVNTSISAHMKGTGTKVTKANAFINNPTFPAKLQAAINDPNCAEAKEILKTIVPFLSIPTKKVPFGSLDYGSHMAQVIAQARRYNNAAAFITWNFDDVNNPNVIRLCVGQVDNSNFPSEADNTFFTALSEKCTKQTYANIDMSWNARARRTAENPVASAHEYIAFCDAVMEVLLGREAEGKIRQTATLSKHNIGVCGTNLGFVAAHEAHAKGTMHCHYILFGGLSTSLLSKAATNESLKNAVTQALNKMYSAEISPAAHMCHMVRTFADKNKNNSLRDGMYTSMCIPPKILSEASEFKDYLENRVVANHNFHMPHSFTCHKGLTGRHGCRLNYPRGECKMTCPVELIPNKNAVKGSGEAIYTVTTTDIKNSDMDITENILPPKEKRAIIWDLQRRKLNHCFTEINSCTDEESTRENIISSMEDAMSKKFPPQYISYLQELDSEQLKELYSLVQSSFKERNLSIVQYNPLLASLVGVNTAVYHLGSTNQSVNTLCYIIPYLLKNKVRSIPYLYN